MRGRSGRSDVNGCTWLIACVLGFMTALFETPAWAEPATNIPALAGDRLGGLVLPVEPRSGPIQLNTLRAWTWTVDDTKRLLLSGDVEIHIADFSFEGELAVIWIDRIPSADGLINQIVIFLPEVTSRTSLAGTGPQGRNLLITGSSRGDIGLNTSIFNPMRPVGQDAILDLAQRRLSGYVSDLMQTKPVLQPVPELIDPAPAKQWAPTLGGSLQVASDAANTLPQAATTNDSGWLKSPQGIVAFSADELEFLTEDDENVLLADGSVVVSYRPTGVTDTTGALRIAAERAVVFLEPGSVRDTAQSQLSVDQIRGVYLEGNVIAEADRDDYMVRAPRMYYDFKTDQAIMVNAVMRTYDRKSNTPVYARAAELRQISANRWTGKDVNVSASAFFKPTLAIGSRAVTIDRVPGGLDDEGSIVESSILVDAKDNTLRSGDMPFFYWPRYRGGVQEIPLRGVRTGFGDYEGVMVETTWDVYSLLGIKRPEGIDMTIDVDGYTKRGGGLGYDLVIDQLGHKAALDLYGMYDSGQQVTDTGIVQDVPKELRWATLWENTLQLDPAWLIQTQASWFSDSTFVTSWRPDEYRNRREYETSAYLNWQGDNDSLSMLAKYNLNDFLSNSWLTASLGYQTEKLPEVIYQRYGDSYFGDRLSHSWDLRVSRLRASIPSGTEESNGLRSGTYLDEFGQPLPAWAEIENAEQFQYMRRSWVNRASTRQELAYPLKFDGLNVTPFGMAQVIGYLEEETTNPDDTDQVRLYGSGGVKLDTQFQRVYNDVENEFLGLHRLRHVLEPYAVVWYGVANYDPEDFPNYEPAVDGLNTGGAVRVGMTNTLQTHRGGPGRWHAVNWLTVDTNVVFSTSDRTERYPYTQFFDWQPAYSQLGNFFNSSVEWQVSDALAFLGTGTVDFDLGGFSRASIGMEINHTPRFSTFVEYRFVEAGESKILSLGANYEISDTYVIAVLPQYDFNEDKFQSIRADVTRAFPDFDLSIFVDYDSIRGETRFGASLGEVNF
ncbi:MAG: hypothetical protein VX527_01275 [Planctomycetota bacterium]|nr:hypothetical protein [Planctomycetota bacterium]